MNTTVKFLNIIIYWKKSGIIGKMADSRAGAQKAQYKHLTVQESREVLKEWQACQKDTGAILKLLLTGQI